MYDISPEFEAALKQSHVAVTIAEVYAQGVFQGNLAPRAALAAGAQGGGSPGARRPRPSRTAGSGHGDRAKQPRPQPRIESSRVTRLDRPPPSESRETAR